MAYHLTINSELSLTGVRDTDRQQFFDYLQDKEIYNNTLLIPFPYRMEHADEWIAMNREWEQKNPKLTSFAIREASGLLVGSAGFHDLKPGHKVELGYWVAKRFWGKGIATAVVAKLVNIAIQEYDVKRITATTFSDNGASQRCLEKNEFQCEGLLKKYYLKDGKFIDAKLFARVI